MACFTCGRDRDALMMVNVPRPLMSGRTPMRVKRLSWSVHSLVGRLCLACGSANAVAPAAKGEAAVAAPSAESIPDCLRTSRRDQRALRKRDMGSPFLDFDVKNVLRIFRSFR